MTEKVHILGKLMKKSNNKYKFQMQERYVKVQGSNLYYYKKENDEKELGLISLESIEFIRPYDRSIDCKKFELMSDNRLYIFAADTAYDAKQWVDTIDNLLIETREQQQLANRAKFIAETPLRIRLFDEEGIDSFYNKIQSDLDEIYPLDLTVKHYSDEITLHLHLGYARLIQTYLEEFLPEIKHQNNQRYDILSIFLVTINEFLYSRLLPILQEDSELIDGTNLGDLHTVIDWITKFQLLTKRCYCPLLTNSPSSNWLVEHLRLTNRPISPNYCDISEVIPSLCDRYVNGNSNKGIIGAASHLIEHCLKVWKALIQNPNEMLQRHLDGSFYTHTPTDVWEALNQHISLATSTQSPILHIMIADKVKDAMNHMTDIITEYVESLDTSNDNLKEIELEYFCALANDNALNIEEVFAVIDNFELDDIRSKIIDIFDGVTVNLVRCGQFCLNRIANLVLSDINESLKEVFTHDWLEGSQVQIITATLTDYMSDLETYLMPFWNEKFVYILLEQVILNYTRTVLLSQHEVDSYGVYHKRVNTQARGMVNAIKGFGNMIKMKSKMNINDVLNNKPANCIVDAESLGRLAQDVNILNAFFCQRAGQETATEFLGIINEVSLMLFSDPEDLVFHVLNRIALFPSSAQAICDILFLCMSLRNDVTSDEIETLRNSLKPAMNTAPIVAQENVDNNIAEGRLGLLYSDLNTMILSAVGTKPKRFSSLPSLARKLKDMANIPLAALKKAINELDDEDIDNDDTETTLDIKNPTSSTNTSTDTLLSRRKSVIFKATEGLVEDVLEVIQQEEDEIANILIQKESERQINAQREQEQRKQGVGIITLEGHLDKKSPAHNLWQSRWFKLSTRIIENEDLHSENGVSKSYVYTLMWYKKKGGAVVKALDSSQIQNLQVVLSNRELVYDFSNNKLSLASEVKSDTSTVPVKVIDTSNNLLGPSPSVRQAMYSFSITTNDNKEIVLKTGKIDKMIIWMNHLATVSRLTYDSNAGIWMKNGVIELLPKSVIIENHNELVHYSNISNSPIFGSPKRISNSPKNSDVISGNMLTNDTKIDSSNDKTFVTSDKVNYTNEEVETVEPPPQPSGLSSPRPKHKTFQPSNSSISGRKSVESTPSQITSNPFDSDNSMNEQVYSKDRNEPIKKRTSTLASLFGTIQANNEIADIFTNDNTNSDNGKTVNLIENENQTINVEVSKIESTGPLHEDLDDLEAEEERLKAEELQLKQRKEEIRLKRLQQQRQLDNNITINSSSQITSTQSSYPPAQPKPARRTSLLDLLRPKPIEPARESEMTLTSVYDTGSENKRTSIKDVKDDGTVHVMNPLGKYKTSPSVVVNNPLIDTAPTKRLSSIITTNDSTPTETTNKRISTPRKPRIEESNRPRSDSNSKSLFKNAKYVTLNNEETKSPQSPMIMRSVSEDYQSTRNDDIGFPIVRSISLDDASPNKSTTLSLLNPSDIESPKQDVTKNWNTNYNDSYNGSSKAMNNNIFEVKNKNKLNSIRKVSFADESEISGNTISLVSINEYDPKANTLGNIVEGRESDISRESTNTSVDSSEDKISITPINIKSKTIQRFELGRDSDTMNKKLLSQSNSSNQKSNGCGCCTIT